jgi:O-acetyl-ADP-ribose deacetylase (regulator of RNase III)
MDTRITVVKADITKLQVDAIVNAANSSRLGGGGVDGAIHRAAGPQLLEACRKLNGCKTGKAKLTGGFKLPAKYVIHTVGPVWQGGGSNEEGLLKSCYEQCMDIAQTNRFESIAFPNISTGVYGFPKSKAAEIAIETVHQKLQENTVLKEVQFVCFDEENFTRYSNKLKT